MEQKVGKSVVLSCTRSQKVSKEKGAQATGRDARGHFPNPLTFMAKLSLCQALYHRQRAQR